MFRSFRKPQGGSEDGFTLVELLVTLLIVAVLAAIAVPFFLRQKQKGWESQARTTLKNAATAMESHGTENLGDYSTADNVSDLEAQGFRQTSGVALTITSNPSDYTLVASHSSLSCPWKYKSSDGTPAPDPGCTESGPVEDILDTLPDLGL